MNEVYRNFFTASVGASAAFIGLLFVALSFINAEDVRESTRELRRIFANNSFSQLVNVFFVSLVSLYADVGGLAMVSLVLGILGLVGTARMLPQANKLTKTEGSLPWAVSVVPVAAYLVEILSGLALLHNPGDTSLVKYLAAAVTGLYGGALVRAWEITGLRRH